MNRRALKLNDDYNNNSNNCCEGSFKNSMLCKPNSFLSLYYNTFLLKKIPIFVLNFPNFGAKLTIFPDFLHPKKFPNFRKFETKIPEFTKNIDGRSMDCL